MNGTLSSPILLSEPDIYSTVYDYIQTHTHPTLDKNNIYRGWPNRSSLPASSNEYAVITILLDSEHGTNIQELNVEEIEAGKPGYSTIKNLNKCDVQIDFCSDSDDARMRAKTISKLTSSDIGVEFFNRFGMSCLYADPPKDFSYTDGSKQFVQRWMVTLHLTYWSGVSVPADSFNTVKLQRFENVDVHHPAKN